MIPKPKQTRTDTFLSHNCLFTLYIQKAHLTKVNLDMSPLKSRQLPLLKLKQ